MVQKHLSCQKGCSACCHTQVSATQEEALLLTEHIQNGLEIDKERLYVQQKAGTSAKDWFQLDYQDRACIFLSDGGECRVYEDRPSVCRTNFVISNPALCDTSDGKEKPIRLLSTLKSDMVIYAAFKESKKSGTLPALLWECLNDKGENQLIFEKNWSNKKNLF